MVWYIAAGLYLWTLFKLWLSTIFVAPFKTMDMLWLLVPIWISWFFAEFFQEKLGTSMGNAITNSVVVLWGSIDWTRQTVRLITSKLLKGIGNISARCFLITCIFAYSITIIILGFKGNKIIKHIARIREVTYVFAVFTPVLYNAMPLTLNHLVASVLFFPVFYYTIELIDRLTPNPESIAEEVGGSSNKFRLICKMIFNREQD